MFRKLSKTSSVKNILVISLSNIGDVLLSAPVVDILMRDFPLAKISLVTSQRAASLFDGNSRIERVHIFDKDKGPLEQARWVRELRAFDYDVVVDLKNSMLGYFLMPRWLTPPSMIVDRSLHLKDKHLEHLRGLYEFKDAFAPLKTIAPSAEDERYIDGLVGDFLKGDPFVFIAPYAADSAKTWTQEGFAALSRAIAQKYALKIIMIGSQPQAASIDEIIKRAGVDVLNLAGKTSLIQIAALIRRARIAVVHDSGPMHIASYFDRPVLALFGPTDPAVSCPWSSLFKVVRRNGQCRRCQRPSERQILHHCMEGIKVEDALEAFGELYAKLK